LLTARDLCCTYNRVVLKLKFQNNFRLKRQDIVTIEKLTRASAAFGRYVMSVFRLRRAGCALIGENGAGKSTLGKIIAGVDQSDSGKIVLNNEVYNPQNPLDAQRRGVSMIFQELDLFPKQHTPP
jgi:ABC-type sugar transport system ATPase subunit